MRDLLGTRYSFSVAEGLAETVKVVLLRDDAPRDLSGSVWRCACWDAEGAKVDVHVEHGAQIGELYLSIPALEAGTYRWELVTEAEGEGQRVLHGALTAISSKAADLLVEDLEKAELRTLEVGLSGESWAVASIRWLASEVVGKYAQEAKEAAESCEGVLNAASAALEAAELAVAEADEALERIAGLDVLLASFREALYTQIKVNPQTNTWVIAGHDTMVRATGEPGKSPRVSTAQTWLVYDDAAGQWVNTGIPLKGEDGRSPYITSVGTWALWQSGAWVDSGVRAYGVDGVDGDVIRRIVVDALPAQEDIVKGAFYYLSRGDGSYDVYAYIESQSGDLSWVNVGEHASLATKAIYGLVKLGSDLVISGGAPVGADADGQLAVPLATPTDPGVSRPSCWDALEDDNSGAVGLTEDGRLRAESATNGRLGSVKLSTGLEATADCIGLMNNGSIGLTMATEGRPGAIKLGSKITQINDIPYILAPGATSDGRLCQNLLTGGCIRHQNAAYWTATGMENLPQMGTQDVYAGLFTSPQFEQFGEDGLTLKSATSELVGGVTLCENLDDPAEGSVVPAGMLVENFTRKGDVYPKTETYAKGQLYTREQVDAAIAAAVAGVKEWVRTGTPLEDVIPPGSIMHAARSSMNGWLLCDGSQVSREQYAALFAAIGTKFNREGDSDNALFRLPDMRGRFAQGASSPSAIAQYRAASVPNVRFAGLWRFMGYTGNTDAEYSGALYVDPSEEFTKGTTNGPNAGKRRRLMFDASRCSDVYKDDADTVQPASLTFNVFIKY